MVSCGNYPLPEIYRTFIDPFATKAEEFDPDRFLDERLKKYLAKNPFIFLPFNAGPRICLGQQVGERQKI